ncbi:MAG: hypothetical protein HC907_36170 [Richelia sp. SM1_7_0]|nr:hypothetical protein [Richelia sp. SM1_7_0]
MPYDYQYIMQIGNIVSLSGITKMILLESAKHVRQAQIRLPRFISEPVVTATVHSKQGSGTIFALWNIDYQDVESFSLVTFIAQNIQIGDESDLEFLCNFMVVGEIE